MSQLSVRPQSCANHRAWPPPVYLAAGVILAVEAFHQGWIVVQSPSFWSVWGFFAALALVVVWYESRRRAQIVQDRVIRGESRARLERVLGAGRRADIDRLKLSQLIALRFASDAEVPALVSEVLAGTLTAPDEIKRRVTDWQADWLRV